MGSGCSGSPRRLGSMRAYVEQSSGIGSTTVSLPAQRQRSQIPRRRLGVSTQQPMLYSSLVHEDSKFTYSCTADPKISRFRSCSNAYGRLDVPVALSKSSRPATFIVGRDFVS